MPSPTRLAALNQISRPHFIPTLLAVSVSLALSACLGGGDGGSGDAAYVVPAPPADPSFTDSAPVQDPTKVLPFVDYAATNQRGDARYATLDTNAGVRVLSGFLSIWKPSTLIVDAGVTAPATDSFPAVVASTWTGIPGDATDGTILNRGVHDASINYVISATSNRTADQELAAYLDDRRGKGYSVSDGLGPLTNAWRTAAQQTTSITSIPADAGSKLYNDSGNNTGVGGSANVTFGTVVDFVNAVGNNASTEPAKRFYKYARPWRWSNSVKVAPSLVPAESSTPATDGGFPSGHTAEGVRDALAMAYVLPERYQELVARSLELGENRILAGMHSPTDVIGGRILGTASAAANLVTAGTTTDAGKAAAYNQAHTVLMAAAGVSTPQALNDYAHSATVSNDRFADWAGNRAAVLRRLTYGLPVIADTTKAATVPKGAEVLLETRQPYLSADQRRVVLKTTALASGYPVLDDAEGWGRLNLFAAADGYGSFSGSVVVNMDASRGGFNAQDLWRNDISGSGKLTKSGSGTLALSGANSFSGGTEIKAGTLEARSALALGKGDVYVGAGTLAVNTANSLSVAKYTQLAAGTLQVTLSGSTQGQLLVTGQAIIDGGSLVVKFANGYKPKVGDTISVLSSGSRGGRFGSIKVDGFNVTPQYSASGVLLHLDS